MTQESQEQENELREQRNRFLAFSFASADLLLEIDDSGKICFALGAAIAVTGIDPEHLKGRKWIDIFDIPDQKKLNDAYKNAKPGTRLGPFDVRLDQSLCQHQPAIVTAITMPDNPRFYLTLGFPNAVMERFAAELAELHQEFERTQALTEKKTEFERTQAIDDQQGEFDRTDKIADEEIADFGRSAALDEEQSGEFDRTTAIKEDQPADFGCTQAQKDDEIGEFVRTEALEKNEEIPEFARTATIADDETPEFERTATTEEDAPVSTTDSPTQTYEEVYTLLNTDRFLSVTEDILDPANGGARDLTITLIDFPHAADDKNRMGRDNWEAFTKILGNLLKAAAFKNKTAAHLKDERYGLLHANDLAIDELKDEIIRQAKELDPENGEIDVTLSAISAATDNLNGFEISKALIYIIHEFERKGPVSSIDNLNAGFNTYLNNNEEKVKKFKSFIEQLYFDFHFHPIIDMTTLELSHYEIITRFKGEESSREWFIFGEDLGMSADLDIAVCERAISYLLYKAAGGRTKYALNLSGQSMQDKNFVKKLLEKLGKHKDLSKRLIFEITETTAIKDFSTVNLFIRKLKKEGFTVCMDDFGPRASAFPHFDELNVDMIKLDGLYTRKFLKNEHDRVIMHDILEKCNEKNIPLIAEKIETAEEMNALRDMGFTLGQGFLFGRPGPWPDYDPRRLSFGPQNSKKPEKEEIQ